MKGIKTGQLKCWGYEICIRDSEEGEGAIEYFMGKIVPFKQKTLPDNLASLGEILKLKIQEGKFDPTSDYAKEILRCIGTATFEEADSFLNEIEPIVISIHWSEISSSFKHSEKAFNTVRDWLGRFLNRPKIKKIKNDIYNDFFAGDKFLGDVFHLVPIEEKDRISPLGKTKSDDPQLIGFLKDCFKSIISKYGLSEALINIFAFAKYLHLILTEFPKKRIYKLLNENPVKFSKKDELYIIFLRIAEHNLSLNFKSEKLSFTDLCKLLILRYKLKKKSSDVCSAILDAVSETSLDEIMAAFELDSELFSEDKGITYKSWNNKNENNFIVDLYIKLHDENKLNYELAFNSFLIFSQNLEECPLNYLILGSIYTMDEIVAVLSDPAKGFFHAGIAFFKKGLYKESMTCLKASLFNAAFIFDEDPVELIDMSYFGQVTKKLNIYDDSINFLSKFKLLSEQDLPINQGLLNEIEITKTELEYEHETRTYYKIDQFYELVAEGNFPLVQSHITELKDQSKFVLTRDQLKILINKIQEKSDIIRGMKSISAKCDMLIYMHREIHDKQAAIFETLKENQSSLESFITQNTEKIIEYIHRKNETLTHQINMKTVQEFYHNEIGFRLWKKLDENTRKYLMLARHLDVTHQFSPTDEFGFIAIEYALAIENEFKKKIIDNYLSKGQPIRYKTADRIKIITQETKITLGEICLLVDKTRKVKNATEFLWPLHSFIIKNTHGKQKIFEFKNNLFEIKDKYRNPAAHPSNYTRELLDLFKAVLFGENFMKNYLEAVQVEP